MADFNTILTKFPTRTATGDRTFAGVLVDFFDIQDGIPPISDGWNMNTQREYINDFCYRLLPAIAKHRAIKDLEEKDYVDAINSIMRNNPHFNEDRRLHYIHLVETVYYAGVERNQYEDKLGWRGGYLLSQNGNGELINAKKIAVTPKSLSADMERKVLAWYKTLDPTTARGEEMGLAISLFCGTRNNEACGADYGSIFIITEDETVYPFLRITQTTTLHSNELKLGGKTGNAFRIIPLPLHLYRFLMARKEHIEAQMKGNDIAVSNVLPDPNSLPIACKGYNYTERSKADDLSKKGHELFDYLKLKEDDEKSVENEWRRYKLEELNLFESDPTTYLFRRNYATYLHCLGLTEGECQYLMGHEVESATDYRNFYNEEDTLLRLWRKLASHPYNSYLSGEQSGSQLNFSKGYIEANGSADNTITFRPNKPGVLLLEITCCEPLDDIAIACSVDIIAECTVSVQSSEEAQHPKPVNVTHLINKIKEKKQ